MRVFAVSDLHADFAENFALLDRLSPRNHLDDVLIVAGDIAHRLHQITETLSLLRSRFSEVFYVPGNHELWVKGEVGNSIDKFHQILSACDSIGIRTRPATAGDYFVAPLFSWYDEERFDDDPELEGWGDFHFCRWPEDALPISSLMLKMNGEIEAPTGKTVISFSHFLPRPDLLPHVDYLRFKGLPRVACCAALDSRIRSLGSSIHIFGHSHINLDRTIDGVRYVQHAMLYPKERSMLRAAGRKFWPNGGPLLELVPFEDSVLETF